MVRIRSWIESQLKGDPVIWIVVFLLSVISVLVVYSATGTLAFKKLRNPEIYLLNHGVLLLLSIGAMWVAHRIDYRYYAGLSKLLLWISVPLLIYTFFKGATINEASRWIVIPVINKTFQSSDLAGFALITSMAAMLSRRQQNIHDFKEAIIPILLWCGIICGLIALTNLSSAALLFMTCMMLLFIGRVPVKYLAMLLLVGVLTGALALNIGVRSETARNRIESYLDDTKMSFQAKHAQIAVASGGFFGKGPGNSTQRNILPHPYSDFVFAIIVEEYGMLGGVLVLLLYLVLLYRGMRLVVTSERAYGGLLAAGLTFSLVFQALINISVAVGLFPVTGMPLPLVSMGGTSLLFTGISIGIILSISRGERDMSYGKSEFIKNMPNAA